MPDDERDRRTAWHTRRAEDAAEELETDPDRGLSASEVEQRLERYGRNRLKEQKAVPWWRILLRQFHDPLIYVLLIAGGVTLVFQDYTDAVIIWVVVLLNAAIGFYQEYRARSALLSLAEVTAAKAIVLRDGSETEVETEEVVPGDIVLLRSGSQVPADIRLIKADDLEVDESALTGESSPAAKQVEPVEDEKAVPGDQVCMAFSGTSVTRGRGRGVVVRTGSASELGQIAEKTEELTDIETPIKKKMDKLGKGIAVGILGLALVATVAGFVRGTSIDEIVETSVAMAVGAVPEALPVVLTVTLAIGVTRMAKRNALIRSLPAVETLGSTTVVGSDKTGTLTTNQMTVRAIWTHGQRYEVSGRGYAPEGAIEVEEGSGAVSLDDDEALRQTLLAGLLANEVDELPGEDEEATGDPTEVAVAVSAVKAGFDLHQTREENTQVDVIPFESERKFMATLNETSDGRRVYLKGAPEAVVERCSSALGADGNEEDVDADALLEAAHDLAHEGFRVLGMATGEAGSGSFEDHDPGSDLVFVGFQAMEDPLRPEAKDAVEATQNAGIRVIMLTGDHADTAEAIGAQLGLTDGEGDGAQVREGRSLEDLSDEELDEVVQDVNVFARVSPEHKLRLVERLKAQGNIVAVTGDGVNDAPALQVAHLGIAMGRGGTDVAREASEMVLTDDNFASITEAVEEGRVVFSNIRKVTYFLLSTGLGEVLAIMTSLFMGLPLPFIAVQVLWINLVTNGLQDVALAFEKGEPGLLDEPPRDPGEGVVNREVLWRLGTVSVLTAVATLGVFWWVQQQGASLEQARSIAMTQMVLFQFFHVFNSRSMRRSIFQVPLRDNPFLVGSVAFAIIAHLGVLHLGFLQRLFDTTPLALEHWLLVAVVASSIVVLVEVEKLMLRRREREKQPHRQEPEAQGA